MTPELEDPVEDPVEDRPWDNRAGWGPGPWDAEGDFAAWHDEFTGLLCVLARGYFGAWCGYVAVPAGHPWHGLGYHDLDADVVVHGGLTFADVGVPRAEESRDDIAGSYFLGFDCNHAFDLAPGMLAREERLFAPGEPGAATWAAMRERLVYRDQRYAAAECQRLARQIAAAGASRDEG